MTEPTVRGATSIGDPERRRKKGLWWLLGLLGALALLGLLAVLLLNRDDGKDDSATRQGNGQSETSTTASPQDGGAADAGSSTTSPPNGGAGGADSGGSTGSAPLGAGGGGASTSSTAPGGPTSGSPGSGGQSGGSGTGGTGSAAASLRSGSTPLLPVPSSGLKSFAGRSATGTAAVVQSVVSDEGFWVGPSAQDRVFVMLAVQGESPQQIKPGQRLSFTGTVEQLGKDPASLGVEPAEGAAQLSDQGAYVVADEVSIDG